LFDGLDFPGRDFGFGLEEVRPEEGGFGFRGFGLEEVRPEEGGFGFRGFGLEEVRPLTPGFAGVAFFASASSR
jgi:hypothetical protein